MAENETGYNCNPDLCEQINSLLWQVENREILQGDFPGRN
jgi:hypothetical protein